VVVDAEKNQIVISTTNKKYFKRISAPNGETMKQSEITWNWGYDTLVIKHKKPPRVIGQDEKDRIWRLSVPVKEEGADGCPTQ
jgi:hypothetical protein